jgi:hypothetical protein
VALYIFDSPVPPSDFSTQLYNAKSMFIHRAIVSLVP